jgi:hypothetical protein
VDGLPLRQRQVIHLRWHEQASYEQIAEALGISPKTVGVHLGRAIQRLGRSSRRFDSPTCRYFPSLERSTSERVHPTVTGGERLFG